MNQDTIDEKTEQIEFFGKEVRISNIKNPHLKRLLSEGGKPGYTDWSRWSCYNDSNHADHSEYHAKYHEYCRYSDRHNY